MIIRNADECKQAGMPPLAWICGACNEALYEHYPVIFVGDRNQTGYHLACAALLASEISDVISDYLCELSSSPPTMEQAFRKAVRLRVNHSL